MFVSPVYRRSVRMECENYEYIIDLILSLRSGRTHCCTKEQKYTIIICRNVAGSCESMMVDILGFNTNTIHTLISFLMFSLSFSNVLFVNPFQAIHPTCMKDIIRMHFALKKIINHYIFLRN